MSEAAVLADVREIEQVLVAPHIVHAIVDTKILVNQVIVVALVLLGIQTAQSQDVLCLLQGHVGMVAPTFMEALVLQVGRLEGGQRLGLGRYLARGEGRVDHARQARLRERGGERGSRSG
eukprot:CAMPEP_0113593152 /NCGR_PEP_ID=MMETSP0015_2-20120614/38267_1 /TAXON_ID=2838 /ORGANISM="Odontella" /LENGTH=119 /DNA_ID=CAMNT_0000499815 /DNA_START=71 /DNA_END=427 /DNA_ORIENTATION=- /assembly_acc=CAM_ASM_000160